MGTGGLGGDGGGVDLDVRESIFCVQGCDVLEGQDHGVEWENHGDESVIAGTSFWEGAEEFMPTEGEGGLGLGGLSAAAGGSSSATLGPVAFGRHCGGWWRKGW